MQYQQIIHQVDGVYSLYRLKYFTAGTAYRCLVCGKTIQKKSIVYYKSSDLQMCSDCLEQTRRPNTRRITRISKSAGEKRRLNLH